MKKIFLIVAVGACVLFNNASFAQNPSRALTGKQLAAMFPPGVKSPECNPDGTVTFRFQAGNARQVELNCQMFDGNKAMTKDEEGVWSITVTPPAADIYPYCFVVDGIQVTDPNNVHIFPNENFKNSLIDVRGAVPDFQDMQDVPHGKISYRYYHSVNVGFDRPLCVYTPAGYDPKGKEKYPVLYLIHGMTDTYETWFKVGRINMIFDNLIAQGLAEKMIVVMPYANPYPEMMRRGLAKSMDYMGTDLFTNEILNEVIPYMETNYRVRTDADGRAIAGFSLGGRQSLACGLGNPGKFHYVCAFAPAIFGNEMSTNFDNGIYAKPEIIRSSLKLMWLSCGTSDFLYQTSLALDKALTERGIEHKTMFPGGGHTWMNCRDYITQVAQLLFK